MGQYLMMCRYSWAEGVPADAPATKEEALAHIDHLYESGTPFFTKEAIRAIYEQFQRLPAHAYGAKVFAKDLTGATVEFQLEIGKTEQFYEEDDVLVKKVLQKPVISYRCRAHLRHDLWMQTFHEDRPHLCSLWVFHDTQTLQEDTKELVEEYPISPREVVADAFQKHIQSWKESDMCSQLVQVLDSSATTLEINKIVGVALGTISQYTEDSRNRSAFQHALVLTLREWLLQTKQDFPCYVQDPNYNPVDHSILGEYGVEVIDDPRAWLEIDEMSILFSCSPNVPVKEIVADIARPAVVIWEHVGFRDYDKEGKGSVTDPDSSRVRAMMEEYEHFGIGRDQEHFTEVVVYIRKH